MKAIRFDGTFSSWRSHARSMMYADFAPSQIQWIDENFDKNISFFEYPQDSLEKLHELKVSSFKVSKEFLALAQIVSCCRTEKKWQLLYELLWRLKLGEKNLLSISSDPLMDQLLMMRKAIRRDIHKMRAFVRFKKIKREFEEIEYIAWYEPDHFIVEQNASFFIRRFGAMNWGILTPDLSIFWNAKREELLQTAGYPEKKGVGILTDDPLEDLWRSYYSNIFNPARIKIKAMKKEMPVRFWKNLPESRLISSLIREAPSRLQKMGKISGKI